MRFFNRLFLFLMTSVALCGVQVRAGSLTADEIEQIENAFGITLTAQEKTDLGNLVKPDTIDPWRTAAEARIAANRQTDLHIQIEDASGNPVPGAQVTVKLNKNAFRFGGVVTVMDLTDASGNLAAEGSTTDDWKRITTNLFNSTGLNNGFKPKIANQHQYIPGFMDWATNNNLDVRAHLLMWPGGGHLDADGNLSGTPGSDYGSHMSTANTSAYASYNVSGAVEDWANASVAEKDARLADLKNEVDSEIAEWAGRWNVYEWDVINETLGNTLLQEILGWDQMAEWFKIAETNKQRADTGLYINEFKVISANHTDGGSEYNGRKNTYMNRINRVMDDGGPITGLGFQSRFKYGHIDPATTYSRLDDFATAYPGLTLAGTEFEMKDGQSVGGTNFVYSEYLRAQMTEEMMTTFYSHDQVIGLNVWDFINTSSSADPVKRDASMAWYDGTIKLNGLVWYYLHRIRYTTDTNNMTDVFGAASVTGYKGDYDITVSYNGTDYPASTTLTSNQTMVVVLDDVFLTPSDHPPIFTSDPISKLNATSGTAYTGESIANAATDADGDTLYYAKLTGPAWLTIASNGDLSGTPTSSDSGQNSWLVQVSDGYDTALATLKIFVNGTGGGALPETVNVSEDQFIHSFFPDEVQTLDQKLDTRNSSHSYSRIPYLKFIAGSLPGTIATATLNVYSESELNQVQALAVADSGWSASSLTWNNAPPRGSLIGSGQAVAVNSWFTIDVTSHITGAGTFSIALDEQGNTSRDYLASSRSSNGAYLYITFTGSGNTPPIFDSDPIAETGAFVDTAYSAALAVHASDGDADPMTFAKVSGPSWLDVAANGTLAGTPLAGDLGSNAWKVSVTDGTATNFASLIISVGNDVSPYAGTNILFIAIDDINPILGCYGNPLIQTPNIDSLAARGMLFENAHCQWSVCGPSRASLMTGLMPEQGGVMGFVKMRGDGVNDSRDNAKGVTNLVTIPQHFINYGYETAASGKINDYRCVGSINPDGTINEDGGSVDDPPSWSYAFASPGGVGGSSAYTTNGTKLKLAAERVNRPATDFVDGAIATAGLAQLNALAAGSRPFFLGVGFKKPHLPFLAPESSWSLYDDSDFSPAAFPDEMLNVTSYTFNNVHELRDNYYLDVSGTNAVPMTYDILPDDQQRKLQHGYYACISHVDEQVGRILDELDALGLANNTIVVLWGDHGFHLGDHNEWGKHSNLEQATRVPFIISAPGYPQGLKTAAPIGLLDIYPTLCELAGLPLPEQPPNAFVPTNRPLAGRSLVPILLDSVARVQTGIMNHYGGNTYGYAYRTDRYRYTEWIDGSGTIKARELYDYEQDPQETINLAIYPEYEALMYQYSKSMRTAGEAGGCDRLKASAAVATPTNLILPALDGTVIGMDIELAWPDAAGSTYTILQKANLLDATWSTNQAGVAGSPYAVPADQKQSFYRVQVGD